ncbi:MAG: 3-deoxy-7-phosphoheptulonate synthase [Thermotogaceae bacterium]|jgi:3-deoxy-7-phosphoheptulonate synthase|nr:3-deoxy-7-phosphoheptulonate synthase [Thermotogaceae bacterium]
MIVILKKNHTEQDLEHIIDITKEMGFQSHVSRGTEKTIIGVIGDDSYVSVDRFENLNFVDKVVKVLKPYKLVSKEFHPETTVIDIGEDQRIGAGFAIIAGPCAVESEALLDEVGAFLNEQGVSFLRGGAFKPRTSPYSFQGLGLEGLKILKKTAEKYHLKVVTELMSESEREWLEEYADIIQIGSRNAQNFRLLERCGQFTKPILLKRGYMNRTEEFLQSAEYIMANGNPNVILCERGIRTFETVTRNTLDLSVVPYVKEESHLPIIVDPSHATGKRELVPAMVYASWAAGADGIMVEIHPDPEKALSDGRQSLDFKQFESMREKLNTLMHTQA